MRKLTPPPNKTDPSFDRWMTLDLYERLKTLDTPTDSVFPMTDGQARELIGGGSSLLHYHAEDRKRANHTGTQPASTISDFASAVQALLQTSVSAHNLLLNLAWTSSGHTGTATRLAGFNGSGAASEYAIPLDVTNGGSGRVTATTAYGLLAAGTTAAGVHQTLAAGATTEILVGGGAAALPAWTTATGTGAPARAGSPTFTGTLGAANITTTGDVGIGAAPPAGYHLYISKAAATTVGIHSGSATGLATLSLGRTASEFALGVIGAASQYFTGTAAGDSVLAYGTKLWIGTGDFDTAGAAKLVIDSSGQVAIGGTSPSDPLSIWVASGNVLRFEHTTTNAATGGLVGWYEAGSLYGFINQRGSTHAEAGQFNLGNNNASGNVGLFAGGSQKFKFWSDGRFSGTALHNTGTVTGTTDQFVASGTYTPSATGLSNLDSVTPAACQWMRVGNVVTVSGKIATDATASGTPFFNLSLPITSSFAATTNAAGAGVTSDIAHTAVQISANASASTVQFLWSTTVTTADEIFFTFTYVIL